MAVELLDLWLPILLGAVLAWIASALIHMALKYHNSDYRPLANEDEVATSIKRGAPRPGIHAIPHCADMGKLSDPAMQAKFVNGPVAFVTVFPNGLPQMGKLIGQQILYFLVGCVLIAWCASLALPAGASGMPRTSTSLTPSVGRAASRLPLHSGASIVILGLMTRC